MKKSVAFMISMMMVVMAAGCGFASGNAEQSDANDGTSGPEIEENLQVSKETADSEQTAPASIDSNYEITRDVYGLVTDNIYSSTCEYSDFEIDEKGNVVSANVTGSNCFKINYEYDERYRLVKSTTENAAQATSEQNWIYDENGRLTELRLVETKDGSSSEKITTYEYDEEGNLIGGQRETPGGSLFDCVYECDNMGRLVERLETGDGETQLTEVYSYADGSYNPEHSVQETPRNKYEIDYTFDDRGRLVKEHLIHSKGEMDFRWIYEIVGEITESPETTEALVPGDKWEYFEDCSLLPIPASCLTDISIGDSDHQFLLPTYKGCFLAYSGEPAYEPSCLDSTHAYVTLDRYINILTDVLGFEVKSMGTIKRVSQGGKDIADLTIEVIDGIYTLTIVPAS